jgi:peptide/nickel transport system ATP-binding protein
MAGTGKAHLRDSPDVLLRIEDLVVEFPVGRTGLKSTRSAASASTC